MDGTVRENILMGSPFKVDWYNHVVDSCGLRMDFGIFQHGDQTIVGDRGIQCSGGQRARLGLARALYRDADVLVADDPLSAVDSKVGRQIFQEAIMGLAVNRGKCVILATHQHQYVHDHRCVLLMDGHIEQIGTYDACVTAAHGKLTAHSVPESSEVLDRDDETPSLLDGTSKVGMVFHENDDKNSITEGTKAVEENKLTNDNVNEAIDDSKEDKVNGVVQWSTYMKYIDAMGGVWVAMGILFVFCATQGTVLWTVTTMGRWAERPPSEQNSWDIIGLVLGQGILLLILAIFRAMISFAVAIKASKRLHDKMSEAILRAKISFFDTNPMGRILNRFSADVGSNDDHLPETLFDFSVILFIVLGALCTTIISLPFALLALPPLLYYFIMVRRIFVTSTRELKRLEGLARSPIYAMMSESLSGVATIRANDATDFFSKKFEHVHDAHTRAFFSFIAASRWVGFRMDSLVFLLLGLVCFLSVRKWGDWGWSLPVCVTRVALSLRLSVFYILFLTACTYKLVLTGFHCFATSLSLPGMVFNRPCYIRVVHFYATTTRWDVSMVHPSKCRSGEPDGFCRTRPKFWRNRTRRPPRAGNRQKAGAILARTWRTTCGGLGCKVQTVTTTCIGRCIILYTKRL
jgi:ATP-binding cassette subfamily C (CFTR/MRP) protein 4